MEQRTTYTGPERRESPRYRVSLRARWGGGEWAGRGGTVTDLSADGCFVTTEGAVAEGDLVQVEIELSGGESLPLGGASSAAPRGRLRHTVLQLRAGRGARAARRAA